MNKERSVNTHACTAFISSFYKGEEAQALILLGNPTSCFNVDCMYIFRGINIVSNIILSPTFHVYDQFLAQPSSPVLKSSFHLVVTANISA